VLFVGTAEPRKGLDVLVEAMTERDLAPYDLVVVGPPGWGDVDVAELAARAGLTGRVHVTGRVDEPELASLYAGACVLAMPSRAEGFGFPVVEAMAHGVPVVVTTDPALMEVGGEAAVIVPVGDPAALAAALAAGVEDGPDRRRRVALGRERAAAFDWDLTASTMWSVYASAAALS
jgi:glycosyltransferase involved in cell wall biosynthesis